MIKHQSQEKFLACDGKFKAISKLWVGFVIAMELGHYMYYR